MDEEKLKAVASQLSCPQGEGGVEIGNVMNKTNEFITARTIESVAPQAGEVIAEIGPGNGALSEATLNILGEQGKYYGIELSGTMAEEARQRLSGKPCAVEIINSDCLHADIADQSLDALFAINVLYFIENLDPFLQKIKGWLKPGGRVVFGVRSDKSLKALPFTEYGFNIRTPDEIKQALLRNGFTDVDSDYYDEGTVMLGELSIAVDSVIIRGSV